MAAARIHRAETSASESCRSKAIVLLTDGEDNSGKHSVAEAAALARRSGAYASTPSPSAPVDGGRRAWQIRRGTIWRIWPR